MYSMITGSFKRTQELLRGNSGCITVSASSVQSGSGHAQIAFNATYVRLNGRGCMVFDSPVPDSHHSNVHTVPRSFNTIKEAMLLV